jgi:hypothetical protein
VRFSQLITLASSPDIAYIQPTCLGEGTPQGLGDLPPCSDEACQTVLRARQILGTDLYSDGYGKGPISLFDTGVTITHPLLAPVSDRFLALSDCLSGDVHCSSSTPDAVDECDGHGTCTAGILTGSDAMGADTRGVLTAGIRSFMVYERLSLAHCRPDPDYPSIHRAFDDATVVDHPDPLIVAEVAGNTTANEGISIDADNVFWDHSVMVVAALGNTPGAPPGSPGNARCAFSAGLYDIRTPDQRSADQSGGVTDDGRTKPDAIFPSCTRTASLRPGFDVDEFDGTSGATPFAGAMAAILHDWLADDAGWVDPGQVYAAMIALGDEQRTRDGYAYPKYEGAGRVMMPSDGCVWWGKVDLHDDEDVTIPIDLTGNGGKLLSVGLWWPERRYVDNAGLLLDTHSDIDLYVLRANGDDAAHSIGKKGVFERVTVALGTNPATWSLRAHATTVRPAVGLQTVYWFAVTRPVPN